MPTNPALCPLALAFACTLALAAGCDNHRDHDHHAGDHSHDPGTHGHDHTLRTVDLDGLNDLIRAKTRTGKVTVVEVWATWCAPCVDLIPLMKKAAHDRAGQMHLIGLSIDGAEDQKAAEETLLKLEQDIKNDFGIDADLFKNGFIMPSPDQQQALLGDTINPPTLFIYSPDGSLFKRIDGSDAQSLIGDVTQAIDDAIAAAG
ncbi:MAG: TlpA disulfide reductase family protein [Planctomycetota bacterium]